MYQLRDGGHNEEVLVQTPNDKLVQDFLHCANCVRNALQMAKGTYQACARGDSDACKMPDDQEFAKFAEIESRAESDAQMISGDAPNKADMHERMNGIQAALKACVEDRAKCVLDTFDGEVGAHTRSTRSGEGITCSWQVDATLSDWEQFKDATVGVQSLLEERATSVLEEDALVEEDSMMDTALTGKCTTETRVM